ncbi:Hypothetical protein D9617_25g061420 [Elsinoe fawcettii]|nr:Hypothetical protein D9617_25g061420 [Elsinoe fawcettii]
MEALSVPTVTEDDLHAFHTKHFPSASLPTQWFISNSHDAEDDDDGLGWYSDGVKRYITDDQIAIFRHSELFKLIRAREIAEISETNEAQIVDNNAEGNGSGQRDDQTARSQYSRAAISLGQFQDLAASNDATAGSPSTAAGTHPPRKPLTAKQRRVKNKRKKRNAAKKRRADKAAAAASSDSEEGEISDAPSGGHRPASKSHTNSSTRGQQGTTRKWNDYIEAGDDNPDHRTHRRLARELDEQKAEVTELSYD